MDWNETGLYTYKKGKKRNILWKRLEGNEKSKAEMSSLKGYILCDFEKLVKTFGEPEPFDNYKTDAHWTIGFSDQEVATIYNWKNGINYLGNDGLITYLIPDWHIGGHNANVVRRIAKLLQIGEMDWSYS
mgnify:CR=1 FL=1